MIIYFCYCKFNCGSYLEFKGIKDFVDSRREIFCEEFSNITILKDLYRAEFDEPEYIKDVIEKYNITHLLLYSESSVNDVLNEMENIRCLYEDNNFYLYEVN